MGQFVHALRYLPFAILFPCTAIGWHRIANTWPWRLYFASVGIWLLFGPSMASMPYKWGENVYSMLPGFVSYLIYRLPTWQYGFLILAMINDLLPRRGRRHWSHWVPAVQPLLAFGFAYLRPFVWDFFHPYRDGGLNFF